MGEMGRLAGSTSRARTRWWAAGLAVLLTLGGAAFVINARSASPPELDDAEDALQAVRHDIRAEVAASQGEICADFLVPGDSALTWVRDEGVLRITGYFPVSELPKLIDRRLAEYGVPRSLVVIDEEAMKFDDPSCSVEPHG